MASLAGANYYNGGWTSSSWYTGNNYGWPGLGSGKYIVLKITAATASESMSGRFRIQLPVYCASTVSSYPVRCAVTTTAPSFSSAPSAPSSYTSWNLSVSASYTAQVVYTPTTTISSGSTYYVWIWSTSSTVAYHGHHSDTGYISAVGIVAPTVSLGTYKGFYSGTSLSVNKSSYGYAYACTTSSGTFWRKITSGTSITVDADTSTTSSKSFYIFRADSDLGSSVYYNGGVYGSLAVPRFACAVYNGASGYTICSGNSGNITLSKSGYTFKGLSTSATSTSYSTYTYSSSTNGKVYYAVYTQSSSITYYRGSSASYSATRTRYLFGKGSYNAWALTEPTRTCVSNSAYSFVGWSTGVDTTKEYDTLLAAGNAGATTVYGVYKKNESSSATTLYYYRGSSTKNSVTKTTTIAAAYYYGKGSTSGGGTTVAYGTITSTCASDSNASLVGWTTSSSSTTSSYSTAKAAFDAGQTTIYGIFKKSGSSADSTVYYYRGSSTKNSVTKTTKVADKYYYGAGSTSGGGTTYSYGTITSTCASDSNASLVGWTTSSSSTTSGYSTATAAFNAGNSTIYGIFKKAGSSSNTTVYYYRGNSTKNEVTKTTAVADKYYYGAGSTSGGGTTYSYGTITSTCAADSSASLVGWTASSSSTTSSYSTAKAAFDAGNSTIYGIFQVPSSTSTSTVYYYAGTATRHSVTKTTAIASMIYYGEGSTNTGETVNTYGSISPSVDGWTFTGFTISSTAMRGSNTAEDLFNAGNTTIYANYSKSETMTYDPQNGKPVGTASITNYLYGTGQSTNYYPAEPTRLAKANHSMKGWGSSQSDTTVDTWNALWDAGIRIVYAIFEPTNYIRFGEDSSWIEAKVYYGVDGVWKPSLVRYMHQSTENTSVLGYTALGNINLGE